MRMKQRSADVGRYPNQMMAFEAGREAGKREERERADREREAGEAGQDRPETLTLEAIRGGRFSDDELVARKQEVDRLLRGEAA